MSITPTLEAAIVAEIAAQAADPRHPSRIAFDRVRADFPNGGDEARAAFHRYLAEERVKKDTAVDRSGPKTPTVGNDGIPYCSTTSCPKYARYLGRCTEENVDDPSVCIPAVKDMVLALDAHNDASEPAFDEIVKLCGLAKTWEYPAQVVRDVEDALKRRDDQIADDEKTLRESIDDEYSQLGAVAGAEATIGRLREDLAKNIQANVLLRACTVYARDRRGGSFDFDEWIAMVDKALVGVPLAGAIENAQTKEERAWTAVTNIRADRDLWKKRATVEWSKGPYAVGPGRDPGEIRVTARNLADENRRIQEERTKDLHVMTRQGKTIDELRERLVAVQVDIAWLRSVWNTEIEKNNELREQLRIAEAIRDDAKAASQRYLDERRALEANAVVRMREYRFALESIPTDGKGNPLPGDTRDPQHSRECGTAYRGCAPGCAFAGAQPRAWLPSNPPTTESPGQCPWILDDEDPDEGYWHCKHRVGHNEVHETEFGAGRNKRWRIWAGRNKRWRIWRGWTAADVAKELAPFPTTGGPIAAKREDGALVVGPPPDGRSVDDHLDELAKGGPTLGGEDLSPDPELRRKQILAVVMGAEAPSAAVEYVNLIKRLLGQQPTEAEADRLDRLWYAMADDERAVINQASISHTPRTSTGCSCSPKYSELAPGVHAKYCVLAGQPLSDQRKRWRCEPCDLTFRREIGETNPVDTCLQCGKPTTEVA